MRIKRKEEARKALTLSETTLTMPIHSFLEERVKTIRSAKTQRTLLFVALLIVTLFVAQSTSVTPAHAQGKWCSNVTIRFFNGGNAGDAFASIVYKGAQAAQADLGPKVDFVFSNWTPDTMISQLRDAIAAKPDGIAMMGH